MIQKNMAWEQERNDLVDHIKRKANKSPFLPEDIYLTAHQPAEINEYNDDYYLNQSRVKTLEDESVKMHVTSLPGGIAPHLLREIEDKRWFDKIM